MICPHCHEARISLGWAYLCHPHFKIRCLSCGQRSSVKLLPEVWWKNFLLANVLPVSIALAVAAISIRADQLEFNLIDNVMIKWFGVYWNSIDFAMHVVIIRTIQLVIALTPIILVLTFSVRVETRMIAYHSTLLPVTDRVTDQATTPEHNSVKERSFDTTE